MTDQKNLDANFCGNLAIHRTNAIQDYGCLLVVDLQSLEIVQGSENVSTLLAIPITDLLGQPLQILFPSADIEKIKNEVTKGLRNRVPFSTTLTRKSAEIKLNILIHIKPEFIILEIEEDDQTLQQSFADVFQTIRSFISEVENSDDLQEICQASIREIRRIAGFDGIRMYQFDANWNGTVIAEDITGELESYLGQTFPASDVPRQARAMYIKNPYRLIPNRNYQPSRLFPVINPITNHFIDLSDCNLRSVAAVHLEYMANMNVTASMSIRVMVDGNLWGLISCHHITAKYLSLEIRSIFEWLSMEISYRISSVIKQKTLSDAGRMLKLQAALQASLYQHGAIDLGLTADPNKNLLSLFSSTGFALMLNGKIATEGVIPGDEELENLFLWASGKAFDGVYSTHELGKVYQDAEAYQQVASGILVIPFGKANSDVLICFRTELIEQIKWGGNPNEAIRFDKDGENYHPRNSFKLWQETVRGQSQSWTPAETDAAESLRRFFAEFKNGSLQ